MSIDDDATRHEELCRELSMTVRKFVPKKTGFCHNCGEETEGVYCSPECREDDLKRRKFAGYF